MQNNTTRKAAAIAFILVSAAALIGCNESQESKRTATAATPVAAAAIQGRLCEIRNWKDAAEACKDGDVVSVLPNSWGNDQLPLVTASVLCDLRYHVVSNNGGVVCVYTGERFRNMLDAAKQSAAKQIEEAAKAPEKK